jgi:hypothetical protein
MGSKRDWYLAHRQETIARSIAWKKAHPDRVRRSKRKARGLVNPVGEAKSGPCECCGKITRLYLDHDHVTGQCRGWLCHRCNQALGWWETIFREGLDKKFFHYLAHLNPPIERNKEIPSRAEFLKLRKEGYTWNRLAAHFRVTPGTAISWVKRRGISLKQFTKFTPSEWVDAQDIKDGETVCEHGERPFECRRCYSRVRDSL